MPVSTVRRVMPVIKHGKEDNASKHGKEGTMTCCIAGEGYMWEGIL